MYCIARIRAKLHKQGCYVVSPSRHCAFFDLAVRTYQVTYIPTVSLLNGLGTC